MRDPLAYLFDRAVARGKELDPPFSNFEVLPDARLLSLLHKCATPAPECVTGALLRPRGDSYAACSRELRRWLRARATRSAA